MSPALVSVIPTFRPSDDLVDLVELLRPYGPVVISDDASPCTSDAVFRAFENFSEVSVIRHSANAGVARGLNDGLGFASRQGAAWLLTVDQDSNFASNYVDDILRKAGEILNSGAPLGVLGAGMVQDASGEMTYPLHVVEDLLVTEEVIQSGSLWRVPALIEVGGFDELLGSDAVDSAACLALREYGYLVAVDPHLTFQHRIGSAQQIRLFGRNVMITHHDQKRRSAMMRNRVVLFPREFRLSPRHAIRTLRRVGVNTAMGNVLRMTSRRKSPK